MRSFIFILVFLITLNRLGFSTVLQDIYENAVSGQGYDKLLILHSDSIYTGGLLIAHPKVGIKGQGAIIDLTGGTIAINGNAEIDLDGCIIINGNSGLHAIESVTARITQCTFYGNQIGIHFMAASGVIEVVNTIIMRSTQYGFACEESTIRTLHYIATYDNLQGDYMEWCPG